MVEYSRNGQSGDLSKTIDKARKRRSGRKKGAAKAALIGATLIAAGTLVAGGLAPGNPGDVPPHEERAAYLVRNLPKANGPGVLYSPYFKFGEMLSYNGKLVTSIARISLGGLKWIWVTDDDALNDPEIDTVHAATFNLKGPLECTLDKDELPDLADTIDDQYELYTEAYYRYLHGGSKRMTGLIGKEEWIIISDACEGRWHRPGK